MPGGMGENTDRKADSLSFRHWTRIPTRSTSRTSLPSEKHHDAMFAIDLESAHNSLGFYPTANDSVLRSDTVLAESLTKIMNIEDGSESFVKAQTKEREASPTNRKADAIVVHRGKPQAASQKTKNHCKRDTSE